VGRPYTLFYDGHCALCHGTVVFVLEHEPPDSPTRFAPLGGRLFNELVDARDRARLPDSVVVRTEDGRLLVRSAAIVHILAQLGGGWGILGKIGGLVPRFVLDALYDLVAKTRYRIFGTRDEACPVIPASLRSKLDLRP
jgi:predicted DCC family thiol-disulfide oxidoreductase YuxK